MGSCAAESLCFELAKGLPAALVTLAIGIAAGLVAVQQYRVARAKLKLDLFEKRIAVFEIAWIYMSDVVKGNQEAAVHTFTNVIPQAGFLFGHRIEEYLRDIGKNHKELIEVSRKVAHPYGNATQQDIDRKHQLMAWFAEEAGAGLKVRFAPFLDFEKWR